MEGPDQEVADVSVDRDGAAIDSLLKLICESIGARRAVCEKNELSWRSCEVAAVVKNRCAVVVVRVLC